MSEGEGVVIPIEARDEFSSAVGRMQEAANALAQAISGVNDKMHELGDTSEKAEHDAEGGGFFGKLKEGYESLNSFKVGDLVHELEETSVAGVAVGASIFKGAEAAMEMEQQVTSLGFASQVSKESINELTEASYKMAEGSKFNAEQIQSVGARVLKMGEDNETANSVMNAAKTSPSPRIPTSRALTSKSSRPQRPSALRRRACLLSWTPWQRPRATPTSPLMRSLALWRASPLWPSPLA